MLELSEREQLILQYLAKGAITGVQQLSEMLEVSTNTIRNDFASLLEKGVLVSVRGGAIPAYYPTVLERMFLNIETKLQLAECAASLINNDDSVMISCGTTCSYIGRFLYGKRNVKLISNSTLFLPYARTNPNLNFVLVGEEFVPEEDALSGLATIDELDNFYPRITIVGSDNFSFESGITSSSSMIAGIMRKMLLQAQTRVLVVEARKFGNARAVKICSFEEIDIIVSDSSLELQVKEKFEEMGKQVIIAQHIN